MKRLHALGVLAAILLFATNAAAQATVRWQWQGGPTSVELGTWSPWRFTTQLVNIADGSPAAGVPFRFQAKWQCSTFEEGVESTGVTDAQGVATSSPLMATEEGYVCDVNFWAEGLESGWVRRFTVFRPESVVLVPERTDVGTLVSRQYSVYIYHVSNNEYVNAGPPTATIGASATGATATFVGASCPSMNSGVCELQFQSNDRPGQYPIEFRYGLSSVTVQVKQRPR